MFKHLFAFFSTKQVYGTLLILLVTFVLFRVTKIVINKLNIPSKDPLERKRNKTLISLINNVLKYVIILIMVLSLLSLYGVNISGIIAGLGIISVVLGFALQDALKDIINGFNIMFDYYFVVGDVVTYQDFTGTVVDFGLKTTKIKKNTGEVLIIANRNIDKVINISHERATVVISIPTAYEEKYDKVERVLNSVLKKVDENYENIIQPCFLGIDSFSESSIVYTIKFSCKKRETQWDLKRAVLKEIKEAYERNHIKIPYNQLEVHNGFKI